MTAIYQPKRTKTLEPDIIKRVREPHSILAPKTMERILNDEKSLATIEGEDKDVTVHLDLPDQSVRLARHPIS